MADETVSFTINADTKPAGKALLELSRLINKAITADTSGADKKIVAQQREYKKLGAEVRSVFKDIKRLNDADKSKGGKAQLPFNQYATNEKKIAELENKQATITDTKELAKVNAELKKYKEVNATMDKYAEQALRQILGTEKTIVADEKSILGIKTETANKTQETANAENNLVSASDKANRSMAETATNAQKARDALKDATDKTNTAKATPINITAQEAKEATTRVENLAAAAARAQANVQRVAEAMRVDGASDNLAELIRRLNTLKQAQSDIKKANMSGEYDKTYNEAAKMVAQLNVQINEYKRNLNGVSEEHKKLEKSEKHLKNTSSLIGVIKKGFKDWHKDTAKIRHSFDSMAKSMRANLKHLITSITKYVLGFRSLFFLIRRLRRYIGEGIKNMAQFNNGSNHVNASITRLLSSLLYLKNAWATAFSPILQFVTPWLEVLIDKIAEAGNAFSRFLGSLLGQTQVFQAVKVKAADYADSLDNVGGSAGGAADKTKKLTDRLAAFDDLNVLGVDKDPNGTGSGGGGGLADKYEPNPNDMFKIVSVADTIKQKLAEMWEYNHFSEFGRNLAQNINESLKTLLDRFPEIKENARKLGASVGSFVSGVFSDQSLFSNMGSIIAEGLNTVSAFINRFFDTYKPGKIGEAIANFFTGAFEDFSWGYAGAALGKLIDGLFTEINALVSNFPTTTFVEGLSNFIKKAIDAIGWDTIGELLSNLLVTAFDIATLLSENLPTEEVEGALTEFLNSIKWGDIFTAIAKSINASVDATIAITNAVLGIVDGVLNDTSFTRELGKGIGNFLANLDIVDIIAGLTKLLVRVIWETSKPSFLVNILVGLVKGLGEALGEAFEEIAKNGDVENWWEEPGRALVSGLWNGIDNALIELFDVITSPFQFIIDSFCELFDIHSPSKVAEQWGIWIIEGLKNGIDGIINTVMEPFIQLQGDLATKWTEIKISASEKWTEIKDKLGEKANDIKSKLSEVWTNIKGDAATAWVMLRVSAVQAFEQLKEALKKPINGVISVVESMVNRIIDGINGVVTKINSIPDIKFTNPFTGTDYKLGFNIPKLSNISIPRLAQGAVIPPNREFMAVLGDQSHGTNVEAPLDTIKRAVAEVLANNGNAEVIQLLQQLITVVERKELTIGDKEIGKANARYINQQRLIRGTSF